MSPWHDNDDFWRVTEAVLFSKQRLAAAPSDVDGILKLLDLPTGAHVLDLCTGPGRHAIELASRGYAVTGVDRTSRYLELAGREAEKRKVSVEFVEEDMRRFVRPASFDAVINIYTSFGYFEDEAENLQVASNVRASLKDGGVALFDLLGKESLALDFRDRTWSEEGGVCLLQHTTLEEDWSWACSRWVIVDAGKAREFQVRVRLYAASEFKALLTDAGFSQVNIFGSLAGAPYDHEAKRLVAVAR